MPLHLLGKKSWNVYNPENIARVRQDEAAAQAREDRAERNQRENDANARLQSLRGERPTLIATDASQEPTETSPDHQPPQSHRKRRKLAGENDTDRDIRLAKFDVEIQSGGRDKTALFDSKGHIDLVPGQRHPGEAKHVSLGKPDSEGVRLADAIGNKSGEKPWYNHGRANDPYIHQVSKDVWGNEDPRRREREQQRMSASDPLSAMKRGVRQLRENEKQRRDWLEERERDLHEVERLAKVNKKRRRRRSSDEGSLEGFDLDAPLSDSKRSRRVEGSHEQKHKRHRRHKHRHRSRSPGRTSHSYEHKSRDR